MKGYSQYCPIARASELFAERWTPVIIRNLLAGCQTFTDIARGAPGISKTLLTQRLRDLERYGIVERERGPAGRGARYVLTEAGRGLDAVCNALGEWGARWLDVAPEHLEPGIALWALCRAYLNRERLPDRRVVVRFDFRGTYRKTMWLLIENGEGEVCAKHPGFEEDLIITADAEAYVTWHMGRLTWAEAMRSGKIQVDGPPSLARAFPSWDKRSAFQHIKPAFARA